MKTDSMVIEVVTMNFSPDECDKMTQLDTLWLQTKDLKHQNVLAYPTNVMVEDIKEACPRKYVNKDEFFVYEDDFKNEWLVSESITTQDLDAFFRAYVNLDEALAA
jgi:hypothetical protein